MRPTTGPMRKDGVKQKHTALFRNSSQPPKGMHINHDDLVALATGTVLCTCTATILFYCCRPGGAGRGAAERSGPGDRQLQAAGAEQQADAVLPAAQGPRS